MTISDETLRVQARKLVTLRNIEDETTRLLVRGWVRAWDQTANDLTAAIEVAASRLTAGETLTFRQLNDVARFRAALGRAAESLDDLAAAGRVSIVNSAGDAVEIAGQFTPQVIASQFPPGLERQAQQVITGRVTGRALDAIVARTQTVIEGRMAPLSADARAAMRSQLVRGITVGDNPRRTAAQIVARTEGAFNGGLARALRIARTEQMDAVRLADSYIAGENRDIIARMVWTAQLDETTCVACVAMHGETFPPGTAGPDGHPNCRCTFIPETKSWTELGFAGIEEPPSMFPDRASWWDSLGADGQVRVAGAERVAALRSGRAGWTDLVRKVDNPDWRPSWQPRPVKDLVQVS